MLYERTEDADALSDILAEAGYLSTPEKLAKPGGERHEELKVGKAKAKARGQGCSGGTGGNNKGEGQGRYG